MKRIFRIQYMRFMAVLTAAAVCLGSVDAGMFRVSAYESDDGYCNDEDREAVSGNDIDDGVNTDDSPGEEDTIVVQTEADEPADKERVTISGVQILSVKKYDGDAMAWDKNSVKVTVERAVASDPEQTDQTETVDVTKDVELQYEFSGYEANNSWYSSGDAPVKAGKYQLVVTASDKNDKYEGRAEYSFEITKRTIIITPYCDRTLTVGDAMPEEDAYGYETSGDGFVKEDGFITEPTVTCELEYPDAPGDYPIIASGADAGNNYDIIYEEGKLTVLEKEAEKAKLVKIISPNAVRNVAFGTKLADIPLPATVQIIVENPEAQEGSLNETKKTATVDWARVIIDGTSYDASKSIEQTFKLGGTVILPDDVELPEDAEEKGLSLNVKIEVHVREKLESNVAVTAPTASIPSGRAVEKGTRVELLCETQDAVIYYTLDGTEPTRQSNRYSIPIVVNGYISIKAFAVKTGYPDSAVARFSYYVSTGPAGGKDDEPEIPKEDMPSNGKIPPGLWTPEIRSEFVYTGAAIKPAIKVYDNKTLLTENKDYTVSYKNNVNAADSNAAKAPTITITGKGNYEGKLTRTFTIKPKSLSSSDVSIDDITVAYNKKAQKPSPTVMWNGKKLTNKKDYTLPDVSYTEACLITNPYKITVTGCGNYTGQRSFNYIITDGIPVSKLTVAKIPDQTYDLMRKGIEPGLTVKYKGKLLSPDQDYSVTYQNNVEVGTATAIIKGMGDYVGTRKVTFKIKEIASLSKAKIDVQFDGTPIYRGQPIKADRVTVTINLKNENGQTVLTTLANNKDYTATYQKNDQVGTATIVFTGIGAYRGTAKKTFKIAACDVQSDRVIVKLDSEYPYMKGGSRPEPVVYFGGSILKLGTDYTLSYKQNTAVGNTAIVTVKGKGNFKGNISKTFLVTAQNIGKVTVSAVDKVYQNKKNIYKTTVRLTDTNGKALSAGTDYNKNIEYTYAEDTSVMIKNAGSEDEKIIRKKDDAVDQEDIISAGTKINVKISAEGAKGKNYTGDVTGSYRIVGANISGAKVTIPAQTYTGNEIKPDSEIQVVLKGQTLSAGSDYTIVGYSNNINKGTAKVVLQGLGNYGGTKTVTFKIKGKGLFN